MKEYLGHWQFWLAVIVVAAVVHWVMMRFAGSMA